MDFFFSENFVVKFFLARRRKLGKISFYKIFLRSNEAGRAGIFPLCHENATCPISSSVPFEPKSNKAKVERTHSTPSRVSSSRCNVKGREKSGTKSGALCAYLPRGVAKEEMPTSVEIARRQWPVTRRCRV